MIKEYQTTPTAAVMGLTDAFTDDRKAGQAIGTRTPDGVLRGGIDKEGVIGVDNGALRIQPSIQDGWGRAGIAYPPYDRRSGLAFAVFMLNGHNTSQSEGLGETLRSRVNRWWLGSETYSRPRRLLQWVASRRIRRAFRQFRWWLNLNQKTRLPMVENLAVGWFPQETPVNVLDGNAFIMHAAGPENGELWVNVGSAPLPAIRGVQNLQIYYVVILREKGAAYYAASVPDANGFAAYPNLRILGIDPYNEQTPMYPGIHQGALGEIGFRSDTRVYGARVEQLTQFAGWYGTAHAADRLSGSGSLRRSVAETGGIWRIHEGDFQRRVEGAEPLESENLAVLDPGTPSGLIHMMCSARSAQSAAGLICRFRDRENFWKLLISDTGCQLSICESGIWSEKAAGDQWRLKGNSANSIQVLDDGDTMSFYLQGDLLFGSRFRDDRLRNATGVGICAPKADILVQSFEAHPRTVKLPDMLRMGEPWFRKGNKVIVADDFQGPQGELAGRRTSVGSKLWERDLGVGSFELTGNRSVKIRATANSPNPGRTTYSCVWDHPEFADLQVGITPPGTGRGQREQGRSGLVLWQDPDNYITVNIWQADSFGGASISSFFHLNGFEDLYDAIWSNVGSRVSWGAPLILRLVFDGINYTAFVNDEPVLYRALTDVYPDYPRFYINRVGILANWEWGNDTGSTLRDFVGRI